MACVRKRRGRWVVDFRDANGDRRWESYRTRKEADAALSKRVEAVNAGTYRPPSEIPTFGEVADEWLRGKADRRPSTYAAWQVHADVHLAPLRSIRIHRVAVKDVERLRDSLRKKLKPQTVNKVLTTAAAIFRFANAREYTVKNPAAVAERSKIGAEEVSVGTDAPASASLKVNPDEVLSPTEAGRLIAAAPEGYPRAYLMTAVLTGLRVGEQTGLTWGDLDLQVGKLSVRRSVSWAKLRGDKSKARARFYEPKTETSRRDIPLPAELVQALASWREQLKGGKVALLNPNDLVFPSAAGTPPHRKSLAKILRSALSKAELKRVNLHSLRHTFASALIQQGAAVSEVAHLLGHSSPAVTLNVYTHWWKATKTETVARLAGSILGANDERNGSNPVAERGDEETAVAVSA